MLQVGKSYKTRDGRRVTIVGPGESADFPFVADDGASYTQQGRYLVTAEHDFDLMAPWEGDQKTEAPTVKIDPLMERVVLALCANPNTARGDSSWNNADYILSMAERITDGLRNGTDSLPPEPPRNPPRMPL